MACVGQHQASSRARYRRAYANTRYRRAFANNLFEAPWCRLVAHRAIEAHTSLAAMALWKRLSEDVDAFAYALAPRNLRQRLRSSGRSEEALEAAAAGVLGQITGGLGVNETRASGWAGESERMVVIAFGTPSRPRVDPSGGRSVQAANTGPADNAVVFGWLLKPRNGGAEPDAIAHAEHLKLQATVSIPSWWRVAVLEEVACWVRPDTLGDVLRRVQSASPRPGPDLWRAVAEEKLLQDCHARPSLVRLPGVVTEISARLGIDVVKRPHIRSSPPEIAAAEPNHKLMVGEPARLVIEGGRLWRNTVVAIGAQRADRISVLPNLRGIVADFACLEPPLLARPPNEAETLRYGLAQDRWLQREHPDHGAVIAPVQVWTSESKAEIPGGVLVRQFSPDPVRGRERPCEPVGGAATRPRAAASSGPPP